MICPRGHTNHAAGARFCHTCGAALPEAPPVERELVAGEVIGWRAWNVSRYGKLIRLASVSAHQELASGDMAPVFWPTRDWFHAVCPDDMDDTGCPDSSDGRSPGENCSCGMYAAQDFEQLTKRLPYAQYKVAGRSVIGEVAMAGKIIVASQGYRAEKARIAKVYVPHEAWKLGRLIADQYNVPYELLRWIG